MKHFKLTTTITILTLTGALDFILSAAPLMISMWALTSGVLGLMGLARRLERDRELSLARVYLPR